MYKVTYKVKARDISAAANAIAIGQSIGNPSIRNTYENHDHAAEVIDIYQDHVVIGFKYKNLNRKTDVAQILCTIQGGQSDIDIVKECRIVDLDIDIPKLKPAWKVPTTRPFIGGIIKPKAGLTEDQLIDITYRMVMGGIDWIKEDEILSDPNYLPYQKRAEVIHNLIKNKDVMYCLCTNGSPIHYLEQLVLAKRYSLGVHTNFWTGLGAYEDCGTTFQHFQRSGIRILTDERNPFGIDWPVIVKLAIMQGVSSIHVGMLGGYYPSRETEVLKAIELCKQYNVIPTLSCGMNPEVAKRIQYRIGNYWLAAVGGWLHEGDITRNVEEMINAVS